MEWGDFPRSPPVKVVWGQHAYLFLLPSMTAKTKYVKDLLKWCRWLADAMQTAYSYSKRHLLHETRGMEIHAQCKFFSASKSYKYIQSVQCSRENTAYHYHPPGLTALQSAKTVVSKVEKSIRKSAYTSFYQRITLLFLLIKSILGIRTNPISTFIGRHPFRFQNCINQN